MPLLAKHSRRGSGCTEERHIAESILTILMLVCSSLETVVMERYTRLAEQIAKCYASVPLKPAPAELQRLFRDIGAPS